MYNLKVDDREIDSNDLPADDISNYLEYKDEIPVAVNSNLKEMTEKYGGYKKISIYKKIS